jgi:predicted glycosyltransferase involved in capsule biosynthesis
MSKINLTDCTFLIPIRIESNDRLRNIITGLCYILANFDTNVIIKEIDSKSVFLEYALPQIKEFVGESLNVNHIFEESSDELFHRMKCLNEMISISKTKVVVNYDCDVLLPKNSYVDSVNTILESKADVVYPYGKGIYQVKVNANNELVSDFLNNDFDFKILESKSFMEQSDFGFCQFFNRESYIKGGMENENFLAYGPEDKERHYRFVKLGYNVERLDNKIYHLEHSRTSNSSPNNPNFRNNWNLWNTLQKLSSSELEEYYKSQTYLKKYNG